MNEQPINFAQKFALFSDLWSPKIIAEMNEYHFKLAKIEGDFVWHSHPETDETFIVLGGELAIDFRDRRVILRQGEMLVVPRGVEHKPFAAQECHILLIEPAGTVNTGDSPGERTAPYDEWI